MKSILLNKIALAGVFFLSYIYAVAQNRVLSHDDLKTISPEIGDYMKTPQLEYFTGDWIDEKNKIKLFLSLSEKEPVGKFYFDILKGTIEINGESQNIQGYYDPRSLDWVNVEFMDLTADLKKSPESYIGPVVWDLTLTKAEDGSLKVSFNDKRVNRYQKNNGSKYRFSVPKEFELTASEN